MTEFRTIRTKEKGVKRILASDKDEMLNAILSNTEDEWFNFTLKDLPNSQLSKIQFDSIKDQLFSIGLIEKGTGYGNKIKIKAEAHDFANRGGFQIQEDFVFGQLKALVLQLDILEVEAQKINNKPELLFDAIKKIGDLSKNINSIYSTVEIGKEIINKLNI